IVRDSSLGVRKYCPVALTPEAIKYPTEPTINAAPMANFVPAFMPDYTSLYLPILRLLQSPRHGGVRRRDAGDVDRGHEGVVEADDGGLDPLRQGDLGQRPPPAPDGYHGMGRAHDEGVAHLAHPGRDRHVDVGVGLGRVGAREQADGEAAPLLRAPRGGFHHAPQPAAQEHRAPLRQEAPDGRRPLRLLRSAPAAADHGY